MHVFDWTTLPSIVHCLSKTFKSSLSDMSCDFLYYQSLLLNIDPSIYMFFFAQALAPGAFSLR